MDGIQEAVVASYWRREDAGGFFDTFYDLFFAKSPEIPQKFANTDMEKQKQVVMASLLTVLRFRTGDEQARRAVEEIGESHNQRGHDVAIPLFPATCQTSWQGTRPLKNKRLRSKVTLSN